MRTGADQSASGLGALGAERFDAVSAVGGWRGVLESAVPILVFVVILAVAPTAPGAAGRPPISTPPDW